MGISHSCNDDVGLKENPNEMENCLSLILWKWENCLNGKEIDLCLSYDGLKIVLLK